MFSSNTSSSLTGGGGLFGSSGGGGLFGATGAQPQQNGSLFGGGGGFLSQPQQQTGNRLFGNAGTIGASLFGQQQTSQPQSGGLFGSSTTTGGGLFGSTPQQQSGGLFGSSVLSQPAQTTAQSGGGLFGGNAGTTLGSSMTGGGLFGQQPQQTGGLFGSSTTPGTATGTTGGLFGQQQTGGGGLFGSSAASGVGTAGGFGTGTLGTAAQPASGGLFGSQPQGGSLFGGAATGGFGTTGTSTAGGFGTSAFGGGAGGSMLGATSVQQQQPFQPHKTEDGLLMNICYGPLAEISQDEERWRFYQQRGGAAAGIGQSAGGGAGLFGQQTTPQTGGGLFGSSAGTTGGGLFGNASTTTGTGLLGSSTQTGGQQTGGLFGTSTAGGLGGGGLFGSSTVTQPGAQQQTGGLFGNAGTTSTTTGGGLFGNSTLGTANQGTGLFGATTTPQQTQSGGLFGQQQQTGTTGGGLFGSSSLTGTATGGGLFGSSTTPPTGGLFGSTAQQPQQNAAAGQTGGGLFGSTTTPSTATGQSTTGTGLFGGLASGTGTTGGGGLFGSGATGTAAGTTGGGLFGNTQQQQTSSLTGGGLFGNSGGLKLGTTAAGSTPATGTTGGLFGSSTTTGTSGGTGLFGSSLGTSGGGLFGNTAAKPGETGGLFGGAGTSTTTGGLFGNTTGATTSGGLLGSTTSGTGTSATGGGGLFGSSTTGTGSGLFGGGGLFGSSSAGQQQATTGGGLFGSGSAAGGTGLSLGQTTQTGLFGALGNLSGAGAAQGGSATAAAADAYGLASLLGGQVEVKLTLSARPLESSAQQTTQIFAPRLQLLDPCAGSAGGSGLVGASGPSMWRSCAPARLSRGRRFRPVGSTGGGLAGSYLTNGASNASFALPEAYIQRAFGVSRSSSAPGEEATSASNSGLLRTLADGRVPSGPSWVSGMFERSAAEALMLQRSSKARTLTPEQVTPWSATALRFMRSCPYPEQELVEANARTAANRASLALPPTSKSAPAAAGSSGSQEAASLPPTSASCPAADGTFAHGASGGAPEIASPAAGGAQGTSTAQRQANLGRAPVQTFSLATPGDSPGTSPDGAGSAAESASGGRAVVSAGASSTGLDTLIACMPAPQDLRPVLTRADYESVPSIEVLTGMTEQELSRVQDFTITRRGYGSIRWPGYTDLRGINLDEVVKIEKLEVSVYGNDSPPLGVGLNRRAIITLKNCKPKSMKSLETRALQRPEDEAYLQDKQRQHVAKVRRYTERMGAKFLDLNLATGEWTFEVEHFSTYRFLDEDDDENDEALQAKLGREAVCAASSRPPPSHPAPQSPGSPRQDLLTCDGSPSPLSPEGGSDEPKEDSAGPDAFTSEQKYLSRLYFGDRGAKAAVSGGIFRYAGLMNAAFSGRKHATSDVQTKAGTRLEFFGERPEGELADRKAGGLINAELALAAGLQGKADAQRDASLNPQAGSFGGDSVKTATARSVLSEAGTGGSAWRIGSAAGRDAVPAAPVSALSSPSFLPLPQRRHCPYPVRCAPVISRGGLMALPVLALPAASAEPAVLASPSCAVLQIARVSPLLSQEGFEAARDASAPAVAAAGRTHAAQQQEARWTAGEVLEEGTFASEREEAQDEKASLGAAVQRYVESGSRQPTAGDLVSSAFPVGDAFPLGTGRRDEDSAHGQDAGSKELLSTSRNGCGVRRTVCAAAMSQVISAFMQELVKEGDLREQAGQVPTPEGSEQGSKNGARSKTCTWWLVSQICRPPQNKGEDAAPSSPRRAPRSARVVQRLLVRLLAFFQQQKRLYCGQASAWEGPRPEASYLAPYMLQTWQLLVALMLSSPEREEVLCAGAASNLFSGRDISPEAILERQRQERVLDWLLGEAAREVRTLLQQAAVLRKKPETRKGRESSGSCDKQRADGMRTPALFRLAGAAGRVALDAAVAVSGDEERKLLAVYHLAAAGQLFEAVELLLNSAPGAPFYPHLALCLAAHVQQQVGREFLYYNLFRSTAAAGLTPPAGIVRLYRLLTPSTLQSHELPSTGASSAQKDGEKRRRSYCFLSPSKRRTPAASGTSAALASQANLESEEGEEESRQASAHDALALGQEHFVSWRHELTASLVFNSASPLESPARSVGGAAKSGADREKDGAQKAAEETLNPATAGATARDAGDADVFKRIRMELVAPPQAGDAPRELRRALLHFERLRRSRGQGALRPASPAPLYRQQEATGTEGAKDVLDLQYSLLRTHAGLVQPSLALFDPASHTPYTLDFFFAWTAGLVTALHHGSERARTGGTETAEAEGDAEGLDRDEAQQLQRLTVSFANELESLPRCWPWACAALLFAPFHDRALLGVRALINRHAAEFTCAGFAASGGGDSQQSARGLEVEKTLFEDNRQEILRVLVDEIGVPQWWIDEADAAYALNQQKFMQAAFLFYWACLRLRLPLTRGFLGSSVAAPLRASLASLWSPSGAVERHLLRQAGRALLQCLPGFLLAVLLQQMQLVEERTRVSRMRRALEKCESLTGSTHAGPARALAEELRLHETARRRDTPAPGDAGERPAEAAGGVGRVPSVRILSTETKMSLLLEILEAVRTTLGAGPSKLFEDAREVTVRENGIEKEILASCAVGAEQRSILPVDLTRLARLETALRWLMKRQRKHSREDWDAVSRKMPPFADSDERAADEDLSARLLREAEQETQRPEADQTNGVSRPGVSADGGSGEHAFWIAVRTALLEESTA
ncbi:nucleoporin autopeptidase [Besnoitia besnoiti]|uniref:Nucleoporin autopeptidase n=1 Tax=Besnoitia besnoiti TaxID=94643 RepID=A0A2A9MJ70_BESBE|nr:nucleoporin autopeptidase [Besnoitia besnoiti]PFH37959.1 nucleoporin autopeptidase [Besnoitia besnoiti]